MAARRLCGAPGRRALRTGDRTFRRARALPLPACGRRPGGGTGPYMMHKTNQMGPPQKPSGAGFVGRGRLPLSGGDGRRPEGGRDEQGNAARDARAWASRVEWTLRGRCRGGYHPPAGRHMGRPLRVLRTIHTVGAPCGRPSPPKHEKARRCAPGFPAKRGSK